MFFVGWRQPKIKTFRTSFFLNSPPSLHLSFCCSSSCSKLSRPARFNKQDNFPMTLNCHLNPASLRRHALCLRARLTFFFSCFSLQFPSRYLLAFHNFFRHVLARINAITHWLWWWKTEEHSSPAVPTGGWNCLKGRRGSRKERKRKKIQRDRHVWQPHIGIFWAPKNWRKSWKNSGCIKKKNQTLRIDDLSTPGAGCCHPTGNYLPFGTVGGPCGSQRSAPRPSLSYKQRRKNMRCEFWGTGVGISLSQRLIMRPVKHTQLSGQIEGGQDGRVGNLHHCSSSGFQFWKLLAAGFIPPCFYGSNTENLLDEEGRREKRIP